MAAADTTGRLTAEEVCAGLDVHEDALTSTGKRSGQTIAFVFNSPAVADPLRGHPGPGGQRRQVEAVRVRPAAEDEERVVRDRNITRILVPTERGVRLGALPDAAISYPGRRLSLPRRPRRLAA